MNAKPKPNCPRCGHPIPETALDGECPHCLMQMNLAEPTVMEEEPGAQAKKPKAPSIEEIAPLFPQLEILEFIGQGGMGAVYMARQKDLDRIVALKILPTEIGETPGFAQRFAREARALAKLNHPGIVTIFDFGRTDGLYFFLMEYVDGLNLRRLLNNGRVEPREALAIVPQICDALQYAHDHGIVHRDIKPENLLLDRLGIVKVADFGLAKIIEGRDGGPIRPSEDPGHIGKDDLTEAGKIMGTPKYMAPEQIEAPDTVDHRADIYALGVVFYQMLTGEMPDTPLHPPSRKVRIDVRLDEVVLRALEQKPALRYQQASILKTEVETIVTSGERMGPGHTPEDSLHARENSGMGYVGHSVIAGIWFLAAMIRVHLSMQHGWSGLDFIQIGLSSLLVLMFGFQAIRLFRQEPLCSAEGERFPPPAVWGAIWAGWAIVGLPLLFDGDMTSVPAWLRMITLVWLGTIFTAPVGTTILGWIAVSQIRRSAGTFRGLELAVFDGLLFPLLALNGIVGWIIYVIVDAIGQAQHPGMFPTPRLDFVVVLTVLASALLNWLIIRRVWRAVKKPLGADKQPSATSQPISGKERATNPWSRISRWGLGFLLAGIILFGILRQADVERERVAEVADQSGFGPVIEVVLGDIRSQDNPTLLSLSGGDTFTVSEALGSPWAGHQDLSDPARIEELRQHGIDLGGLVNDEPGIVVWDCSVHAIGNAGWIAADDPFVVQPGWGKSLYTIFEELPPATMGSVQLLTGGLPQTWLLRTRSNDFVVLQVTAVSKDPRGVKIRYKRMEHP